MLKAIIVEDEMIVRVGIKSMINWSDIGYELVGEAVNGQEAWEMIQRVQPDVVITDIQMPEMNGIELLGHIRHQYEHMKVIILSCHNEFDYVQQALKLGAIDYILKLSVQPDELATILVNIQKIKQKEKEERSQQEQKLYVSAEAMKKQALLDLLHGRYTWQEAWDRDVNAWSIAVTNSTGVLICRVHELVNQARGSKLELLLYSVANIARELVKSDMEGEVVECSAHDIIVLASFEDQEEWQQCAVRLSNKIVSSVKQYLKATISIGIANELGQPLYLSKTLEQAQLALQYAQFYEIAVMQDVTTSMIEQKNDEAQLRTDLEAYKQRLIDELTIGNPDGVISIARHVEEYVRQHKPDPITAISIFEELIIPFYQHDRPNQAKSNQPPRWIQYSSDAFIQEAMTLRTLSNKFVEWIERYMAGSDGSLRNYREEIKQARSYIYKNYHNRISVADIARSIGLSEAYLSHLYKKETGENLIDYLTHIRLEEAKQLLLQTDMRTYEIAERIGYSEANYFSKQFKRYVGLSPLEYRQSLTKNYSSSDKNNQE